MSDKRPLPWPGIFLALTTALLMLLAGTSVWLVLSMVIMWLGSLWIARPEPQKIAPQTDAVQLTRDGMRDLIEQFSLPLLMLDRNRVIIANAAARTMFGSHIIGQDARVGLRHPQAVALLDQTENGSAVIQGLTTARSIWKLTRHAINDRYWVIELHNQTAEADISRAHTDFVANASHELRTPLASIIGYVETLTEDDGEVDPKSSKKFLGTVLREARRLQSLVSDLMSLSRIEAEKHDHPADELDLAQLIRKAASEAGTPEQKALVRLDLPEGKTLVLGDAQQMEQLVRNLVDNALKYGTEGEDVDIKLFVDDSERVILEVHDHGEGIAAEHIPHLTRRFYRTDPGRSRAAGGTGLGLAIVKHIVERHRGRLDITSTRGQGTIVTVKFPAIARSN